ncbi:hypothetical protein [Actinoplanes sp. NPDC051494]|uniref:hypothetical protein n=1 Tax=Actinoplanes sp. NPDC051494 TaxID=3363907 RepID=UPI0037A44355
MRVGTGVTVAVLVAAGVRIARARHRRVLHPDGRSFTGDLEIWGLPEPTGAALIDRPARHPVTVRISKGAGTPPGRPDVLGVAVRVHGPVVGHRFDLLLSTAGQGRWTRHLPVLRRTFATHYGTITPYRTGTGRKLYLSATGGAALGRTLASVVAAAEHDGARLVLSAGAGASFGQVRFGAALSAAADADLAFDPIRNVPADLHPTGTVHGLRALAYRAGHRWRGARPAARNPGAVTRTATHR